MGMLIDIKKTSEDDTKAFYSLSTPEGDIGELSINKKTGDIQSENEEKKGLVIRAGIKLVQHWRKGEFPDITYWAS